jgi:hypothetical protein
MQRLEQSQEASPRIMFPEELEELDHWISFTAVRRTKPWRDSPEETHILCTIVLPVPQSLATGYAAGYANENIGAKGEALAFGGELLRDYGKIPGLIDQVRGNTAEFNVTAFREALTKAGAMTANFLIATTNALTDLASPVMFGAGRVNNPHKAMLFTGVSFRQHQFQYKLAPRSQEESDTIRDLIYRFKYHAAPSMTPGLQGEFFEYPDEFDIAFHYPEYLFQYGPSVLTNMSVEYHPEGAPAYFRDSHAPVGVELKLDFTELTITTKENIGPVHGPGGDFVGGR